MPSVLILHSMILGGQSLVPVCSVIPCIVGSAGFGPKRVCARSPLRACAALLQKLNLRRRYVELLPRVKSGQVRVEFHWCLKHACAKVGQKGQEKMSQ